jgi:hypothetical protein
VSLDLGERGLVVTCANQAPADFLVERAGGVSPFVHAALGARPPRSSGSSFSPGHRVEVHENQRYPTRQSLGYRTWTMPRPKRPHVASMEEVRITRDGDAAIIEYADASIATTHFGLGAAKLAKMSDEDILDAWNECLENMEAQSRAYEHVVTEIPVGKPQVKYFARGDQWVPRGQALRCEILADAGIEPALDEPFVTIDNRDFTLAEFMKMVGTFGGWGMRIEFVPDDELHIRPKLKVRAPPRRKQSR